jgi:hypothetical protein
LPSIALAQSNAQGVGPINNAHSCPSSLFCPVFLPLPFVLVKAIIDGQSETNQHKEHTMKLANVRRFVIVSGVGVAAMLVGTATATAQGKSQPPRPAQARPTQPPQTQPAKTGQTPPPRLPPGQPPQSGSAKGQLPQSGLSKSQPAKAKTPVTGKNFKHNSVVCNNVRNVTYICTALGFTITNRTRVVITSDCILDPGDVIISVGNIACNNTSLSLDELIAAAYECGNRLVVIRDVNTGNDMEFYLPLADNGSGGNP